MAAKSNHYGDVYNWIERVIDSCTNPQQEIAARKLISLYGERLEKGREVNIELRFSMERALRMRLDNKLFKRIEDKINNGN
jgi:hypothetical protein